MTQATAKVINSGDSQVIFLPKEFWLDADEVFITQFGDSLILTPRTKTWEGFVEGFSGLSDDFTATG